MRPYLPYVLAAVGLLTATVAAEPASPSPAPPSGGDADLLVEWTGSPRWLGGAPIFGGEAFGDGLVQGRNFFFGSSVTSAEEVPVEIVFSDGLETLGQTFRLTGESEAQGIGTFPGAAYDVSDPDNPRRLNVLIIENEIGANLTWDPTSDETGNRELLLVMASDYDGTGETYSDVEINVPPAEDILYVLSSRVLTGRELLEADPSTLTITLARIAGLDAERTANGEVTLTWDYVTPAPGATALRLYAGTSSPAQTLLAELPVSAASYVHEPDELGPFYYRLEAVDADGTVLDVSLEAFAQAFAESFGTALVDQLNPGYGSYGDIWGYVDPDTEREYALLAARFAGLSVIDVTDEEAVEVAFVPGLGGGNDDSKDVKVYGHYAYLVHETAPILIIDLADPTAPQPVGQLDVQPGVSNGGSHNVLVEGDYLYVVGGRFPGGLRIYDLAADPTAPPLVGEINGENGQTYYHDLEVVGDTAYAAAIYDAGIDVLDLTDRANPEVITTIIYPATYMGAHNVCASEDGETIFVGDEIGSGPWTRAFDVSDLDDVELVAELIVDPNAVTHNCYVEGDLLYIAHYTEGLQVFDVSAPSEPQRIAFYDTFPPPTYGFSGAWSTYPYLPSGKVLVSDMSGGLFVVRLTDTPVSTEPASPERAGLALAPSYPNPFARSTTLRYALDAPARVRLAVYDVLGREVAVLVDAEQPAGEHAAVFEADGLASGAYFVRLEAGGATATRSVTITR